VVEQGGKAFAKVSLEKAVRVERIVQAAHVNQRDPALPEKVKRVFSISVEANDTGRCQISWHYQLRHSAPA
jgi:hypothetical protein